MELQLDNYSFRHPVRSFAGNTAIIGELLYTASFIVTPKRVVSNWPPQSPNQLAIDDIEMILELDPELILVGTGNTLRFPDSEILKGVISAGIGIDFMGSYAACRTYNILAAEGRHVAAGIIIDQPSCAS